MVARNRNQDYTEYGIMIFRESISGKFIDSTVVYKEDLGLPINNNSATDIYANSFVLVDGTLIFSGAIKGEPFIAAWKAGKIRKAQYRTADNLMSGSNNSLLATHWKQNSPSSFSLMQDELDMEFNISNSQEILHLSSLAVYHDLQLIPDLKNEFVGIKRNVKCTGSDRNQCFQIVKIDSSGDELWSTLIEDKDFQISGGKFSFVLENQICYSYYTKYSSSLNWTVPPEYAPYSVSDQQVKVLQLSATDGEIKHIGNFTKFIRDKVSIIPDFYSNTDVFPINNNMFLVNYELVDAITRKRKHPYIAIDSNSQLIKIGLDSIDNSDISIYDVVYKRRLADNSWLTVSLKYQELVSGQRMFLVHNNNLSESNKRCIECVPYHNRIELNALYTFPETSNTRIIIKGESNGKIYLSAALKDLCLCTDSSNQNLNKYYGLDRTLCLPDNGQCYSVQLSDTSAFQFEYGFYLTINCGDRLQFSLDNHGSNKIFIQSNNVKYSCSKTESLLGIDFSKPDVRVYPNPFSQAINVSVIPNEGLYKMQIMNSIGEIIFSEKIDGDFNYFELNQLINGIYFIEISGGNLEQSRNFKLIRSN